jgi:hypothetical protein
MGVAGASRRQLFGLRAFQVTHRYDIHSRSQTQPFPGGSKEQGTQND